MNTNLTQLFRSREHFMKPCRCLPQRGNGSDRVVNLTATPAHDHNWYDEQNQLVVNQGIIHTAWHSWRLGPDSIVTNRNIQNNEL